MKKTLIAFLVLLIFCSNMVFAATSTTTTDSSSTTTSETEIPDWLKYLSRFEIVTLGSLPFTTMTATTVYTSIRYVKNDFDSEYIPNPFAFTSTAANIDTDEQTLILCSAIGTSVLLGVIDISIYVVKKEKAKKANRNLLPSNVKISDKTDSETRIPLPKETEENSENAEIDTSVILQDENEPVFMLEE